MGKVLKITEKVPQEVTLPDGYYNGKLGGSIIDIRYQNKNYELHLEEGYRGADIDVIVLIKDGKADYEFVNK